MKLKSWSVIALAVINSSAACVSGPPRMVTQVPVPSPVSDAVPVTSGTPVSGPPSGSPQPQVSRAERIAAFNSAIGMGGASGGERYDSLREIVSDSDLVVRGVMMSVELGPSWIVDAATGQLAHRARVVFRFAEVIAGKPVEADRDAVWVTFPVPGPESVEVLKATLPNHEALVFLKNIGDYARVRGLPADHVLSDRRLYRLVGDDVGIVWNEDGAVAAGPSPDQWMSELIGTPFDTLTAAAQSAVARP